jgi:hypothetical protein
VKNVASLKFMARAGLELPPHPFKVALPLGDGRTIQVISGPAPACAIDGEAIVCHDNVLAAFDLIRNWPAARASFTARVVEGAERCAPNKYLFRLSRTES